VASSTAARAEEAQSIRRSAEVSGRQYAEAEGRLRTTFESISDRLQPLVSRLDEESSSARAAVDDATSDAGALETAARQQAQAMIDAASTTAARMRADAETRVEITARQVADVREELALVRQILSSLAPAAGTHASTQGDATSSNGQSVSRPDLSKDSGLRDGAAGAPGDAAGQQTGPVRTPSRSGAGPASSTSAGSTASPSQQTMPVGALPGGRNTPLSPEAPTETIALPLSDVPDGLATGGGPSPGHRQPPG
jgi:phage-related tail protein